jgi:4'-phosphopantetheinyl transferase
VVRVEVATPEAMASAADRAACEAVLSAEERARAARIRPAEGRTTFVLAHALARGAIARAAGIAPGAIAFATREHGKPDVADPPAARVLGFNLSHTAGLAACAIAHGAQVGVDVEARDRDVDPIAIAERFFAPAEIATLRALDPARQRERFLTLWTLKEALLKAIGSGISGGLALAAFDLACDPPRVLAAPGGDASRWQVALLAPTPRHVLAIAVERAPGGADRSVTLARPARLTDPDG